MTHTPQSDEALHLEDDETEEWQEIIRDLDEITSLVDRLNGLIGVESAERLNSLIEDAIDTSGIRDFEGAVV